ncbi:MAG: SsrA-binding protein SmpB [Candidatus Peregrinibacteria bacterium]|nr:SsrA-binding protein SmpB [Candidatus Peregrinibacteria bacterium]MDZ4245217.1 SsrA-binding protein SmpB [Candidatus Gracilibacteria bacterium]
MGHKELAQNKKAYFDYEVLEEVEAGLVLTGAEIKSIRSGNVNLKGSYVGETAKGLAVKNMHISEYPQMDTKQSPLRERRLLLHKKEIEKLQIKLKEKNLTIIPLKMYLKKGYCKLLLGLCKGKKQHDKRDTLKRKDQDMEIRREMKKY